jgi:hypothetical protein
MAPPESGTIAVLAENPVARDIAHVLGATSKGDGYLHGNGYVVAWAAPGGRSAELQAQF